MPAITGKPPKKVKWIQEGFTDRLAPVLEAFDEAFKGVNERERNIMREKLADLNNASPREDVFRFLAGLGTPATPLEQNVYIAFRNGLLHSGHKGNERERDILMRNDQAAHLMANMYHRAFLKALGYSGKYCDSVTRQSLSLEESPEYPLLAEYQPKKAGTKAIAESPNGS